MTGRRWAYVGALLGGAVSIAANVAHSYVPPTAAAAGWHPHSGAVFGAVFWPVALFVAVEILARVAWPAGRRWVAVRFGGMLPVALVAAFVSYRHLSGLLAFYGDEPLVAVLGPLAVDGLMVMATGALIATGGDRTAATDTASEPATVAAVEADTVPASEPPATPPADPPHNRPATAKQPASGTAAKVARWHAKMPTATHAELAAKAGVSVRSVERYRPASTPATEADNGPGVTPVNGREPATAGT